MPKSTMGLFALCVLVGAAAPSGNAGAVSTCTAAEAGAVETPSPAGELTLAQALEAVRAAAPDVRRAALEAAAMRFDAQQAGLRNNPSFETESESSDSGVDESTHVLSQTFRLGNKRRLERRAAAARAAVAEADRNVILLAAELEAGRVFYELAAAAESTELARETARISSMFEAAVARRVEVGEVPPAEAARARVVAASARAAAEQAAAETKALRYALASLWGADTPTFENPRIDMNAPVDFAPKMPPAELVDSHPELAVARAAHEARRAEQRFAAAQAYPDLTVGLGVKTFNAAGPRDDRLVARFSVPLPLFDRRQGTADAARVRERRDGVAAAALQARLAAQLGQAIARVEGAERRRAALVEDALPAAREAERAARVGYEAGEYDLTTALDARNAWVATQAEALAATLDARVAELEARSLADAAPFDALRCTEGDARQ